MELDVRLSWLRQDILKKLVEPLKENPNLGSPSEHLLRDYVTAKCFVKKLFTPPTKEGVKEAILDKYASPKTPSTPVIPPLIPTVLTNLFGQEHPKKLSYAELAMAFYIFNGSTNEDDDMKETLINPSTGYCHGTRGVLQCLKPKGLVDQDVINLVACTMTHEERTYTDQPKYWFFPTTFSQFVLSWSSHPDVMRKFYQKPFMGKVDEVYRVFVPVNDEGCHWYLLVVDFSEREVIYLDSFPEKSRMPTRIMQTKILAIYMEQLFTHKSFYNFKSPTYPTVSEFKVVIPEGLGVQKDNSNDCGVWVATWMKGLGRNSFKIEVDDYTRLKLAVDLVEDGYNSMRGLMLSKALAYYLKMREPGSIKKILSSNKPGSNKKTFSNTKKPGSNKKK